MGKPVFMKVPRPLMELVQAKAGRSAYTPDEYSQFRKREAQADFHRQQAEITKERNDRNIRQLMNRSGVQDIYLTATLDNYQLNYPGQREAVAMCRRYLENFGQHGAKRNMVFCGTTGTGKNHMASAICNALIAMGKSAVVGTAFELQMKVSAAGRFDSPISKDKVIDSFSDVDLLVIDEVELGSTQDIDSKVINTIIDKRSANGKCSILLSNMNFDDLANFVGERIVSRITGSFYLVECKWPDYRARN